MIPGVLFLNKTYGRKDNQHLYKFKPHNYDFPVSFVQYKIPEIGFNKAFHNLYALVADGQISQILGPSDDLDAYCAYQMHCAGLVLPPMRDLTDAEVHRLNNFVLGTSREDRTDRKVFTVDGPATSDYDDAFSICGDILSIYISDVYHILEAGDLWSALSQHVSNIYLSTRTTMLCRAIIKICSLEANKTSMALVMDYNTATDEAVFGAVKVRPYRNYVYGEPSLIADGNYQRMVARVRELANITIREPEEESRAVVEYLMRLTCFKAGAKLYKRGAGIFRTLNVPLEEYLPSNKYIPYEEVTQEPYAHITSPMRRLVDVINAGALFAPEGNSPDAAKFCARWAGQFNILNASIRAIRRIQNEYTLLSLYDDIKDRAHSGLILPSETYARDGIYYYTVFLESIHLLSRFHSVKVIQGRHMFRVFRFDKETNFRKKIRLEILAIDGTHA